MWDGRLYRRVSRPPKLLREGVLRVGFPMHQVDIRRPSAPNGLRAVVADGVEPLPELVAIAMRTVAGEHFDARTEGDLVAEDAQHRCPLDDAATEGVLGLETDDEDGVPRIGRTMREVVQNASRLCHSGGCDDNHGPVL